MNEVIIKVVEENPDNYAIHIDKEQITNSNSLKSGMVAFAIRNMVEENPQMLQEYIDKIKGEIFSAE